MGYRVNHQIEHHEFTYIKAEEYLCIGDEWWIDVDDQTVHAKILYVSANFQVLGFKNINTNEDHYKKFTCIEFIEPILIDPDNFMETGGLEFWISYPKLVSVHGEE